MLPARARIGSEESLTTLQARVRWQVELRHFPKCRWAANIDYSPGPSESVA